jgi:hypothetical protein
MIRAFGPLHGAELLAAQEDGNGGLKSFEEFD